MLGDTKGPEYTHLDRVEVGPTWLPGKLTLHPLALRSLLCALGKRPCDQQGGCGGGCKAPTLM